ncbi:MAG: dockerin type I domain-containing protein [Candidatus Ozemobacteraceae bacterium]
MMVRKFGVLAFLVVFLAGLSGSAAWAVVAPNFWDNANAQRMYAQIKTAEAQGHFDQVVKLAPEFIAFAKQHGGHNWDDRILSVYDMSANANDKLGEYNAAANEIREKNSWKSNPANIDKVMSFEKKDLDQRDLNNKTLQFHNQRIALTSALLVMARSKEAVVKAVMAKKDISKDDLAKMQTELKAIDAKMAEKRKDITEVLAKFEKDTAAYRKDGIILTRAQNAKIGEKARELAKLRTEINTVEKNVKAEILKISEKYQYSWPGLEEQLEKMKGIQTKIMDLQQKMLGLMAKKPLSDADKKELNALEDALDKLMEEDAKTMADIEKSFMDANVFDKLSPDAQRKYMEIFKVIRDAQNVIAVTNKKIDAFLKEMNVVYGDLNGDGKVDQKDLSAIYAMLIPRPFPLFFYPPKFNKAADLDGDGRITWADYNLMKEKVSGARKFFPVDPANQPGDLDGNGAVETGDILVLARMIQNPAAYIKTAFKRIADLNGDGKINVQDLIVLVNKVTTPQPAPAPLPPIYATETPTIDVASGASADVGSGTATGNTVTKTGEGTPADSMNDSY